MPSRDTCTSLYIVLGGRSRGRNDEHNRGHDSRESEYLEPFMRFIKYFLAQRTLSGFTVKSLRASPRNSSSIIRDFLILLCKLWSYSALLRVHSGRIVGTTPLGSRQHALLVLVTQVSLLLEKMRSGPKLSSPTDHGSATPLHPLQ